MRYGGEGERLKVKVLLSEKIPTCSVSSFMLKKYFETKKLKFLEKLKGHVGTKVIKGFDPCPSYFLCVLTTINWSKDF